MKNKSPDQLKSFAEFFNNIVQNQNKKSFKKNSEEKYTREKFINDIVNILIGGAVEFYKCLLHDRLKAKHGDRKHWEKEWRYHIGTKLIDALSHPIKFSNKTKAKKQAIEEFVSINGSLQSRAINTMGKYLKISPADVRKLLDTDNDLQLFLNEVQTVFDYDEEYETEYKKDIGK